MKRPMLILVLLIPLSSVLMGAWLLMVAYGGKDDLFNPSSTALSKTSWQESKQPVSGKAER